MKVLDRYSDGRPRVTPWHRPVSGYYSTRAGRWVAPYLRVRQGYAAQARAWQEQQARTWRQRQVRRELTKHGGALRQMMERRRMC